MAVVLFLAAALAVCLWGGFTQGWDWTGVGDQQRPLALDEPARGADRVRHPPARPAQPTRCERRQGAARRTSIAFVAFIVVGYAVPLEWTVSPETPVGLVDASPPARGNHQRPLPPRGAAVRTAALRRWRVLLVAFLVVVYYGYAAPWEWTGFTGNTLLDGSSSSCPMIFPTLVVPRGRCLVHRERRSAASLRRLRRLRRPRPTPKTLSAQSCSAEGRWRLLDARGQQLPGQPGSSRTTERLAGRERSPAPAMRC